MSPQLLVLSKHLKEHNTISQAEAGLIYKMRALPKRISELKVLGYKITCELKKDATGQRYARYTLDSAPSGTSEPLTDSPVVALNVKPVVGDRVVVVNSYLSFGDYKIGDEGVVTAVRASKFTKNGELDITFDHAPVDCVFVYGNEVEVIANA